MGGRERREEEPEVRMEAGGKEWESEERGEMKEYGFTVCIKPCARLPGLATTDLTVCGTERTEVEHSGEGDMPTILPKTAAILEEPL